MNSFSKSPRFSNGKMSNFFSFIHNTTANRSWAKGEDAEKSDDEDEEEEVVKIDDEVSCPTAS